MANTQTTVPIFTAAQVLEAAQLNDSAATGVPVFATTVTRDAAFGGSGEKALAQGQLCYLEATDVVQYYNGSAWATLAPAPAVSSGLTFISSTNLSGSSTTISNCFSATYECYFVTMSNMLVDAGSVSLQMRLGSGTNHTYNNQIINAPGDAIGTGYSGTNQNTIQIANVSTTNMQNSVFWINSPFLTINTQVFGETSHSTIFTCTQANEQSATSFTDLTYSISASTFSSGVVKIYGYSLS